jgi:cytochrome c-type biogenesis protein CcmH
MFWILAAILTALTCIALLTSLGKSAAVSDNHDKEFYAAQLNEIERQLSLGLIGRKEAEAAKTEAARRLLAVTPTNADQPQKGVQRQAVATSIMLLIPAFVLPIYIWLGAPAMPSFPLAERLAEASKKPAANDQATSSQPPEINVENALRQIENHLAKNPDDGRGHEVIAPIYLRMERYDDAVRAFASALRILGTTAERQANLGEALVYQAKGVVTVEARKAFEAALSLDATHIQSQFFLSMAAQQDGDIPKARDMLQAIQNRIPDGALKTEITQQLVALNAVPKGGEGIAALPQNEQQAAIRGMVQNLAERLSTSGGTPEDWARLVRALNVLGERDRASAILTEARVKFADKPDQVKLIEEAAKP